MRRRAALYLRRRSGDNASDDVPPGRRFAAGTAARRDAAFDRQKQRASARARAAVGATGRGKCYVVDGVRNFQPWKASRAARLATRLAARLQANVRAVQRAVHWVLRKLPNMHSEQSYHYRTRGGKRQRAAENSVER